MNLFSRLLALEDPQAVGLGRHTQCLWNLSPRTILGYFAVLSQGL